ncbi:DUF427 domain-containing protein [Streptomyces sp. cmx-4-9]|uniref:DUF427 domain-containing protein n=1 Tax=Streptomyces sp. cmx-4-9 TaxID=2790941 RepID=UPI00397ED619
MTSPHHGHDAPAEHGAHSGHEITVSQGTEHVRVVRDGQVLAETRRPVVLRETGCPVRYYIPRADVRTDLLTASPTRTACPFKGETVYWSVPGAPDLAWGFPEPNAVAAGIADHFCFYDTEVV